MTTTWTGMSTSRTLRVNGEVRQGEEQDGSRFRDTLPEVLVQLSLYVTVCPPLAALAAGRRRLTGRMPA
jgi:hypothetical protein